MPALCLLCCHRSATDSELSCGRRRICCGRNHERKRLTEHNQHIFRNYSHKVHRFWMSSGTPPLPDRSTDKAVIFDMWNAHTKYCSACQGALQGVLRARNIAVALGIVRLAIGAGPWKLVIAMACFGIAFALDRLKNRFYRYEFVHADNP